MDGGANALGGASVTPPVVVEASCANSQDPDSCLPGAQSFAQPKTSVYQLAAAGLDDEGALLLNEVIEGDDAEPLSRGLLQRIDVTGTRIAEAVEIAAPGELESIIRTSIACDGERYLYCLSSQTEVSCGLFEPPLAHTPRVFEAEGQAAAVAFTQDTWLVAYRTLQPDPNAERPVPVELVLQTFSRDGQKGRAALTLGTLGVQPILTATDTEFVMVAPYAERDFHSHVFWLTPELETVRAPVALAEKADVAVVVAATRDLVAVSSSFAYGSALSLLTPDSAPRTHLFEAGGKLGAYTGLTAAADTITASWFAAPQRLVATTFSSPDQVPPELVFEDFRWVTLRIGERLLGARIFGNFSVGPTIEVVPLPMASDATE
jgi:hypothetical protein